MATAFEPEYELNEVPAALRGCVLTIGNFDGVHRGHQRIVQAARAVGRLRSAPVVALTLEPPPDRVLRPADSPQRLTPAPVKRALLREAGADCVVTAQADPAFLAMPAGKFLERILVERFAARHIVEGTDFFFGRGREGTIELLRRQGPRLGFAVDVVEPVTLRLGGAGEPQRVSSSLIRRLVAAGQVDPAAECMGRPFALFGRVVRGEGRGHSLGFPTVNLPAEDQIRPGDGVYAGRAAVAGGTFRAAISVGRNPTVNGRSNTVEAFLLDVSGDFYGREMSLSFVRRLRDQRKFDTLDALTSQIAKDVKLVRELLQ